MKTGVVYLLTGAAHAARLVVSIVSLRRHYDGPIAVFTSRPESHDIGALCSEDKRLGVTHHRIEEPKVKKNRSFLTKIDLLRKTPFPFTVYLDCDTLVTGSIEPLLDDSQAFIATQFSDWKTTGRRIRNRIEGWRGLKSKHFRVDELVDSALSQPRPSINNGVVACQRDNPLLRVWYDLAFDGRRKFICDEISLHLLLHHTAHKIVDCRWNNSPRYGVQDDVRIWHFHGDKHIKDSGVSIWLPEYEKAARAGNAHISHWALSTDNGLKKLIDSRTYAL